uniref:Uncharacterized protein n=1 Tax=Roseihalotalea indica TaxID=2867963 RepID=A0AA49GLN5_9BACT|nr:hypothetical protein K4G66_27080 [Tunicatimonas sp. TK19036]
MSLIIQQLDQADVMLNNALNVPIISERLAEVGYTEAKIRLGLSTVASTRAQVKVKEESYSSKKLTSTQAQAEIKALRRNFIDHRNVARMAFRHQPELLSSFQLEAPVDRRLSVWLDQASDFYKAILSQVKVMQRYDVPKAELEQTQNQLQSAKTLRLHTLQKKGAAQHATQQRDQALKELNIWLLRFKAAARLALADEPQLLEIMGIVVTA